MINIHQAGRRGLQMALVVLSLAGLFLTAAQGSPAQAYGGSTPPSVVAFYYPWYDIDNNGYNVWQRDAGKMLYQPSPTYASSDPNAMKRQMQQAHDAGIDAFAVTYNVTTGPWVDRFKYMLNNAPLGFSLAIHFEVSLLPDNMKNVGGVVNALRDVRNQFTNNPHYFRYQGRPVVYFWWPQGIAGDVRSNWVNIRNQVDPNHEMIWSVDTIDPSLLDAFDTIHFFSAAKYSNTPGTEYLKLKRWATDWNNSHGGPRRLATSSVTPGYDDRKFRSPGEFRDRAGGAYYNTSWDGAIAAQPNFVTISTWNEWYESTAIEPGGNWGNQYLDITRAKTSVLKGISTPFGDASILKTWRRTDLPVYAHQTDRSWMWGPNMLDEQRENYVESPGGVRSVYYFDKSRMEINRPSSGDSVNDLFYVTNGLLPIELMTGQMKTGDSQTQQRQPANIPVAGDSQNNPNTPTYAALGRVSTTTGNNRREDRTGQTVIETLSGSGQTGSNAGFTGRGIKLVKYVPESGHTIAAPFWDFMNRSGQVYEDTGLKNGQVVDWLFAMGYPISEAYWVRSKVGGVEKDVLVQAFERRVLTYTPDNADSFKVEMGNVGLHYHLWRYGN